MNSLKRRIEKLEARRGRVVERPKFRLLFVGAKDGKPDGTDGPYILTPDGLVDLEEKPEWML